MKMDMTESSVKASVSCSRLYTSKAFIGHFVPAAFYILLGIAWLLLSLHRARNLKPGESFAKKHIPEKDPRVLRVFGLVLISCSCVGCLVELGDTHDNDARLGHWSTYSTYLLVGLCAYWESERRLPLDSFRAAFVLSLTSASPMWYFHGAMKREEANQMIHGLFAPLSLLQALFVAYSMRNTDSVFAYVGSLALCVLQGTWMLTAGLYLSCLPFTQHIVAILLQFEAVGIFFIIAAVFALYGPKPTEQDGFRQDFTPLKATDDEELNMM